jgi:hypothetical protein
MAKLPAKEVKSQPVQLSFAKLIEEKLVTFVPKQKGKAKSPESIAIEENFDSIHMAVMKGLPYNEIAALLSLATGLEIKGGKVANVYRAHGVAMGVLEAPKPRVKKEKAEPAAE